MGQPLIGGLSVQSPDLAVFMLKSLGKMKNQEKKHATVSVCVCVEENNTINGQYSGL